MANDAEEQSRAGSLGELGRHFSPNDVVHGRDDAANSSDDDTEGPRKRVKRNTDSSDSSDNEFAVCEGGVPIDVWPVRGNHSPASQS